MKKIILRPGKEHSLKRFHPWLFSGAIGKMQDLPGEGEYVAVYSSGGECLGTGHYHSGSIAVRMLSFSYTEPSDAFWRMKFEKALSLRIKAGLSNGEQNSVFRLVNAEGDGFPGLIADFYNGTVVFQAHSAGMFRIREQLASVLQQLPGMNVKAVYDKSPSEKMRTEEKRSDGYIYGESDDTVVMEYGNRFRVDWIGGQKTGFFIDQRENRKLVQKYSSKQRVLNMFGYTGGFSVYALRGGATVVHTVDSSSRAIELAGENIGLNFPEDRRSKLYCSEVYDFFRDSNDKYDIIILDPPAFAKNRKSLNNALQAYKRLNARAMEFIEPGGLLFTFSCSQVVGKKEFRQAVYSAALECGREGKIMHLLSQPPDHPVSIFHPEGDYLKGIVLQII
ncbi:MAG: class I SAM-dependent rRNA methyltransferase [bacterium]